MDEFVCHLPICSLCTGHLFTASSPPHQLSCRHLFCAACVPDLQFQNVYKCPFDGAKSEQCWVNLHLLKTAMDGLEALQHKKDPRCRPFVEKCYVYLLQETNTEHVPCRGFYRLGKCPSGLICPYDHTPGLGTRGVCPRGLTCPRNARCAFDHQPPYRHAALELRYAAVRPWYSSQSACLSFTELQRTDPEYERVLASFRETLPNAVVKIERVQNAQLYVKFALKHDSLSVLQGASVATKFLFHGTSKTSPYEVCSDSSGLDSRLSRSGMWGKGSYFAQAARYSYTYAHKVSQEAGAMLLCEVIVGEYTELQPDPSLARPPKKPGTREEFHSVKGRTGGSDVWITYEPSMAYPEYIILFSL